MIFTLIISVTDCYVQQGFFGPNGDEESWYLRISSERLSFQPQWEILVTICDEAAE